MVEQGWSPEPGKARRSDRKRRFLIGTGLCVGAVLLLKWLLDAGLISGDAGWLLVILATVVATFLLAEPAARPSANRPRSSHGKPEIPHAGSWNRKRRD